MQVSFNVDITLQLTPHTDARRLGAGSLIAHTYTLMCKHRKFAQELFTHEKKSQIFNHLPLIQTQILWRFLSVVKRWKKKRKRVSRVREKIEIQKFHRHEHRTNSPCHIATTTSTPASRHTRTIARVSLSLTLNRLFIQ